LTKPLNPAGQPDRLTEPDAWPNHVLSGRLPSSRLATRQNKGQLDVARPRS
jgi:hypothetical protein